MTAPRHPLALLADYLEQVQRRNAMYQTDLPITRETMAPLVEAHNAVLNLDPAALRAQAEAEANRERTYRLALLGLQRQDTGCWCYTLTGGHAPECLQARAALAQAGGEVQQGIPAWGLGTNVVYVGPRPNDYPNIGALRVIPSMHAHLTRVSDGRAEFSAPHAHFAQAQAGAGDQA